MGNWLQTYTGKKFDPFEVSPHDVNILDIAHSLAFQVRFNGHIHAFYSVAQHSYYTSKVCLEETKDKRLAYIALLHDMTEAYLSDVIRPLKKVLLVYVEMEENLAIKLYDCFGVPKEEYLDTKAAVKRYDNIALVTEAKQLLASPPIDNWVSAYDVEPREEELIPLPPHEAKDLFLMKFYQLQE